MPNLTRIDLDDFLLLNGSIIKGNITKLQTTYFESECYFSLNPNEAKKIRLHFSKSLERNLRKYPYSSLLIYKNHPLLIDYLEPNVQVNLVSDVTDVAAFENLLESCCYQIYGKWRKYDEYLNMPFIKFIEKNYGVLMGASKSFAELVVNQAEKIGVKLTITGKNNPTSSPKVMVIDDMYLIADKFESEII